MQKGRTTVLWVGHLGLLIIAYMARLHFGRGYTAASRCAVLNIRLFSGRNIYLLGLTSYMNYLAAELRQISPSRAAEI